MIPFQKLSKFLLYNSLCYGFGRLVSANGETWKVIEVNKPEIPFFVNDDITSVDRDIEFLRDFVGLLLDFICTELIAFLFPVDFFVSEF